MPPTLGSDAFQMTIPKGLRKKIDIRFTHGLQIPRIARKSPIARMSRIGCTMMQPIRISVEIIGYMLGNLKLK